MRLAAELDPMDCDVCKQRSSGVDFPDDSTDCEGIFICTDCIKKAGELLGLIPAPELAALRKVAEAAKEMRYASSAQNQAKAHMRLIDAVDALTEYEAVKGGQSDVSVVS
jgi:hypothetical protein